MRPRNIKPCLFIIISLKNHHQADPYSQPCRTRNGLKFERVSGIMRTEQRPKCRGSFYSVDFRSRLLYSTISTIARECTSRRSETMIINLVENELRIKFVLGYIYQIRFSKIYATNRNRHSSATNFLSLNSFETRKIGQVNELLVQKKLLNCFSVGLTLGAYSFNILLAVIFCQRQYTIRIESNRFHTPLCYTKTNQLGLSFQNHASSLKFR